MIKEHGTTLYDEPPIAVSPTLCRLLDLPKAVFLQQLHYWLQQKRNDPGRYVDHYIDNRFWVYWTSEDLLREIPLGRSIEPHRRVIKDLRALGVLLVAQHRVSTWDRTNFYSIDYHKLDELVFLETHESPPSRKVKNPDRERPDTLIDEDQSPESMTVKCSVLQVTETTSKTTSRTTTTTRCGDLFFDEFTKSYQESLERAVSSLPARLAQQVLDEASGTLRAIAKRERKAIGSFAHWVASLVAHAQRGDLIVQYGNQVAATRNQQQEQAKAHQKAQQNKQANKSAQAQRLAHAEAYLQRATPATRTTVSAGISHHTTPKHIRINAVAEIENGLIPANPIAQAMTLDIIEKIHTTEAENDGHFRNEPTQ